MAGFYDIPVRGIDGSPDLLAGLRGKVVLAVNVASRCGLTPQYSGLEQLQRELSEQNFTVVGFPCNQFGAQEPGSPEEIQTFCSTSYGVTFPLTEKIEVNGANRHPIYRELTQIADAAGKAGDIRWNFEKFVVSADGATITRFDPRISPDDPAVLSAIEAGLPH